MHLLKMYSTQSRPMRTHLCYEKNMLTCTIATKVNRRENERIDKIRETQTKKKITEMSLKIHNFKLQCKKSKSFGVCVCFLYSAKWKKNQMR